MNAQILDGKQLADDILLQLKMQITQSYKIIPKLCTILVGNDPASMLYIEKKHSACEYIGIAYESIHLPANISTEQLIEVIHSKNIDDDIHGILVQLPLPEHINQTEILHYISPLKDVDGLNPYSIGDLVYNIDYFTPCTPKGIFRLLEHYKISNLTGKNVTIIGASIIVGKPLAIMAMNRNATVSVCNINTKKINDYLNDADIIISAAGTPNCIQTEAIKPGAVIIDVGINKVDNKIVGDINFNEAKAIASFITPVPGGVGPMTVAMLMENTLIAAAETNII